MPTGTEKLAASTKKILATADGIKSSLERTAQTASVLRAHVETINPSPETRAIRDRAALDAYWRDRAKAERAKLHDMQVKADEFYGRTTR